MTQLTWLVDLLGRDEIFFYWPINLSSKYGLNLRYGSSSFLSMIYGLLFDISQLFADSVLFVGSFSGPHDLGFYFLMSCRIVGP